MATSPITSALRWAMLAGGAREASRAWAAVAPGAADGDAELMARYERAGHYYGLAHRYAALAEQSARAYQNPPPRGRQG